MTSGKNSGKQEAGSNKDRHAVVIGSGIAGLASSIRLTLAGYQVQVFEAASQPGGKVAEHRQAGYRFDMGPSLFTLPGLLDELFREAGANPADYYSYRKLDTICRYFFPGGKILNAWEDPERLALEFESVLGEPAENVRTYLAKARRIYDLTEGIFLESSLHDWETYRKAPLWKTLAGLPELDAFNTMHSVNHKIFKQRESVQLFDRYATYNGSNPYKAPATLNVIGHLEHNLGAYLLKGGMRTLVDALYRLALERGVQFHFDSTVERILLREPAGFKGWLGHRGVRGVRVTGQATSLETGQATGRASNQTSSPYSSQPQSIDISAELVVSNMDIVPTYRKLLPDISHPDFLLNQPKSTSALIFYWGMDRTYPELDLHNILFSADYPGEFRHLSQSKSLTEDPTVYLYISSKHAPEDAPEGGENWFAMINVPHIAQQDWDAVVIQARERIIRKIEQTLKIPVAPHIRSEFHLDPRDIASRTSSHLGALYGNSSNNLFAAFLRHPNYSRKLSGLYFCGGSVHPGGGVPLCLLSARIVAEQVKKRS